LANLRRDLLGQVRGAGRFGPGCRNPRNIGSAILRTDDEQIHRLSEELISVFCWLGQLIISGQKAVRPRSVYRALIYVPSVEIVWQASAAAHSDDISLPLGIGRTQKISTIVSRAARRLLESFRYSAIQNKAIEITWKMTAADNGIFHAAQC